LKTVSTFSAPSAHVNGNPATNVRHEAAEDGFNEALRTDSTQSPRRTQRTY
jgi:hypothetical protein